MAARLPLRSRAWRMGPEQSQRVAAARRMPLEAQLARLVRLRAADVPQLVTLPDDFPAGDPRIGDSRFVRQRLSNGEPNPVWLSDRLGALTSSQFTTALGYDSPARARILHRRVIAELSRGGSGGVDMDLMDRILDIEYSSERQTKGQRWGHTFEQSALASYASGWLAHACPEATVHETGFWSIPLVESERFAEAVHR